MTDQKLSRSESRALHDAPDLVREFAEQMGSDLAARTSAYRKIAAAARAEREALTELYLLAGVRNGTNPAVRVAELERHNAELQGRVTRLTALPAMVVNGD